MKNKKQFVHILIITILVIIIACLGCYTVLLSKKIDGEKAVINASNKKALTQIELDFFTEYLNKSENNGFMTCSYTKPSQIDLDDVIYDGAGLLKIPEGTEKAEIKKLQNVNAPAEYKKLLVTEIDKLLNEKAGLLVRQLDKKPEAMYIAKYDSYYTMHTDTKLEIKKVVSGTVSDDEIYSIKYIKDSVESDAWQVNLKKVNDTYMFISNMKI